MTTAEQHDARTGSSRWQTSIRWIRIIPVALIMYTIAFIDRTNISLALPHISRDLHLDPQQAGTVAGIFFWGYLALQIPGGHLAKHWSAKRFVSILLAIRMGHFCSGLWARADPSRTPAASFVSRNSRKRRSSRNVNSSLSLVSPFRTGARQRVLAALLRPRVFLLTAVYFCFISGQMGLLFWLPVRWRISRN